MALCWCPDKFPLTTNAIMTLCECSSIKSPIKKLMHPVTVFSKTALMKSLKSLPKSPVLRISALYQYKQIIRTIHKLNEKTRSNKHVT